MFPSLSNARYRCAHLPRILTRVSSMRQLRDFGRRHCPRRRFFISVAIC